MRSLGSSVKWRKKISERNIWKAIPFLRRATEAGPKSLAECSKCCLEIWETNTARHDTHNQACAQGQLGAYPHLRPICSNTHTHIHTRPEEYNFLQPQGCLLSDSRKRGEGPLLCAVHNPACGDSSVPSAPMLAGTVRREDALIRHSGHVCVPDY